MCDISVHAPLLYRQKQITFICVSDMNLTYFLLIFFILTNPTKYMILFTDNVQCAQCFSDTY